jgi:hypothetical protein
MKYTETGIDTDDTDKRDIKIFTIKILIAVIILCMIAILGGYMIGSQSSQAEVIKICNEHINNIKKQCFCLESRYADPLPYNLTWGEQK